MTPGKAPPPRGRTAEEPETGLDWTRREVEMITRRMAARPSPAGAPDAVPPPFRAHGTTPARRRGRLPAEQVAALLVLGLALAAFLAGGLASVERRAAPGPRIAARPPADAFPPPSAAPVRAEPRETSPAPSPGEAGEAVVRAFYGALGRGDGAAASALVVAEKRSSRAFSPQAISRFYGGLPEPLRLTGVTPLAPGAYRVGYRYSAGRSRCEGAAVVATASRDGRDLIRSIRALNGC